MLVEVLIRSRALHAYLWQDGKVKATLPLASGDVFLRTNELVQFLTAAGIEVTATRIGQQTPEGIVPLPVPPPAPVRTEDMGG